MRKIRKQHSTPKLEMTPMIDVVFQLLIFFVFVVQPMDVLGELSAERRKPSPGEGAQPVVLSVMIDQTDTLFVNDRRVNNTGLQHALERLLQQDADQQIQVLCSPDSSHGRLLQVLDTFELVGAEKINITTL